MQPTAQTSTQWQPGGNIVGTNPVGNGGLPAHLTGTISQHGAQNVAPEPASTEYVLRHVGADPLLTSRGPLSPEEHRFESLRALRGLQPGQAPPSWVNHIVKGINLAAAEKASDSAPANSRPLESTTQAVAVTASPPSADVLKHPEPGTSVEELRWRDYQALKQNRVPGAVVSAPTGPQQPTGALPGASLSALPPSNVAPNTPIFPTPVRTLFPPTPLAAVGVSVLQPDVESMDTSDTPDGEQHFQCIYAQPGNAIASPEEMRVVQASSAGPQLSG
ncbi:hypothetical protein VOLCADRAFT_96794 [Volvox carteri f. nagariensis]|uniref:Uncharacterized protein n=1 Tax=Volvox carteri f. nagariensis TaxID=3068 RepID=D8UB28_VOLCA|nr:uncharacterized protein VOLCADRAFT_96794 [Volvox carteri f. nagariensis]EFJ43038.1 hypothetical protein VOLCADRAFT_96794 [Volvox carteri f. nagariensis]|eukprot:XP_002955837.1 hypothetical protein VOLCADRAFT_96794 [Volvox carteri f. nagariensis]